MHNENPIFRSLAIIEKQIHEKLTVETLADSIPLSKYHYQRMFRDVCNGWRPFAGTCPM